MSLIDWRRKKWTDEDLKKAVSKLTKKKRAEIKE
jgi:hypothetical protein